MKRIIFLVAFFLLSGCAGNPEKLSTPSGNPETTFQGVNKKTVIDAIVAKKLEKGMAIKSVTDYSVVATKRVDGNFAASFLYGSKYDGIPEARVTYNIVEAGGAVRVFSRAEMVTNPGSAFERVTDITQAAAKDAQAELNQLSSALSKKK